MKRNAYSIFIKRFKYIALLAPALILLYVFIIPYFFKYNERINIKSSNYLKEELPQSNSVDKPKLYGKNDKGEVFFVEAASALQLPNNALKLISINGMIDFNNNVSLKITSKFGESFPEQKILKLYDEILMVSVDGKYKMETALAFIDYKNYEINADSEIKITNSSGYLKANAYHTAGGGEVLYFKGGIKLHLN